MSDNRCKPAAHSRSQLTLPACLMGLSGPSVSVHPHLTPGASMSYTWTRCFPLDSSGSRNRASLCLDQASDLCPSINPPLSSPITWASRFNRKTIVFFPLSVPHGGHIDATVSFCGVEFLHLFVDCTPAFTAWPTFLFSGYHVSAQLWIGYGNIMV